MGVRGQPCHDALIVLRHPNLLVHGIGLEVDADRTGHVLFAQPARAADVDEGIGLAVEALEPFGAEPMAALLIRVFVRPAVPQAESLHGLAQELDTVAAVLDGALDARVIRCR